MSRRINIGGITIVIIEPEPDDACDLCGKIDELRPYGASGELICYECAMKNPEVSNRMMNRILFGEED